MSAVWEDALGTVAAATRLQVLVVDDHRLLDHGFARVLEELSDGAITSVGVVSEACAIDSAIRRLAPDIVLVHLDLSDVDAVELVGRIDRSWPRVCIVAQCAASDAPRGLAAMAAGAVGVLPSDADPATVVTSLSSLAAGMTVVPPWIANVIRTRAVRPPRLDEEQIQLWKLLTLGRGNPEIANTMHMSDRTLKRKIHALLRALGVRSRLEAAAVGGRAGLLDDLTPCLRPGSTTTTRSTP